MKSGCIAGEGLGPDEKIGLSRCRTLETRVASIAQTGAIAVARVNTVGIDRGLPPLDRWENS